MNNDVFRKNKDAAFYFLLGAIGLVALAGLGAAFYMEHYGHVVTGMTNQIVWGLPHVFALFLIVAASGVLNMASIGSVFGKPVYKARAALSGLLAIAMLAGGLMVLMLDLGRSDRLIIAMTYLNLKSVFALNVFLYTIFFSVVVLYLWTMMDRKMHGYSRYVGFAAFIWRLLLTTGTGAIFGFLVARQAYGSALLPPMFIIMSFSFGLAVFMIVQAVMYRWNDRVLDEEILRRLKNLLAVFVAAVLYFTAVYHMTNLYFAKQTDFERFILLDGGIYTTLFWVGQVLIGSVLPLFLLFTAKKSSTVVVASLLVILGGFFQLYVFLIGGQAFPLNLFPGMEQSSSFFDGVIHSYSPSLPEFLLGMGGIAVAALITAIVAKVLNFMPDDTPHPASH
ncbi:MAG: molybdopterin oxidoreductase [Betaproteobacteria bacterium CG2_30_59_46]|nr:MAG: molybdopterin oxidoreductase [Betaproteobacteria bacterium CG2_30_59_46]PIQ09877.1 MAG: molybdopterin oxidoreductase [Hydrogenophilales bacterium CG18_big_fil_WC_8_21_14_2_50_58_12]PIY01914.1 MAG: molybdopterin oxidoreductase [Hydrogenophilales bacterium CG_4_10_14_3_um_filter_58_23]PJB03987.1 MAG: molybdopterin oxidoreductase [Hydrogenophilales bacterium CG_4_9_14_3_um_filter_59_35]